MADETRTYVDPYSGKAYTFGPIDHSQRPKSIIVKCKPEEHDPKAHGKRAENRVVIYEDEQGVQRIRWATKKEAAKEWFAPPVAA